MPAMTGRPPSIAATLRTVAALTFTRLLRGRALWVAIPIAALPIVAAAVLKAMDRRPFGMLQDILGFRQLVLVVLPALLAAATVGEDIEDRTTTYLWSRPVPRWIVLIGKLVTLIPILIALVVASWVAAVKVGPELDPTAASIVALALAITGFACVGAAIGTLVPKHAMALTVVYIFMFDLGISVLPGTLAKLSISFHMRVIADVVDKYPDSPGLAALGIGIIGGIWLAIGLWRMRRLEA
jgi:ABC-type transport system involved in multi-copper enzyme maturation permease subunit